uniref:Exonuclease 1 n=1 Tax=Peronospora matthiolae TaxID=2874970 RepID=A0AAV1U6T6_9STRA
MGINGFLRQLHDVVDTTHLQRFAGQTLAVDALSFLHKACYGCAFELSTGKETEAYVHYMLRKVHMMRSYGVAEVILVFDGQRLPLKSLTHEKRKRYKEENRRRALEAMADSKKLQGTDRSDKVNKAYQLFQRSVSITPQIISTVMNALRAARIPFVVAPFEADAQMVWLCKNGFAAGIVTEDSDVVVYCLTADVSCPVLVKLEDNGAAQAVSRSILHKNSAKATSNALLRKIHFLTSRDKEAIRMFVQVCVLAGCDFIDSLPNVGFATAVKHIFNFRGAPAHLRVQRLTSKLLSSGTKVPAEFLQEFVKAETIFFHHIVFNPDKRCCELLVHEKHINCFPDVLQRAKESLGIALSDEVDLMSSVRRGDLRAVSAATKAFLAKSCRPRSSSRYTRANCMRAPSAVFPIAPQVHESKEVLRHLTLRLHPACSANHLAHLSTSRRGRRFHNFRPLRSRNRLKTRSACKQTSVLCHYMV